MLILPAKSQALSPVLSIPLPQYMNESQAQETGNSRNSPLVIITDAKWVVNMVQKTPDVLNVKHFARKFVEIVAQMSEAYDELRVVFGQYLLKKQLITREHLDNTNPLSCKWKYQDKEH